MEVTGIQPVGARSLGGVQATVTDSSQNASRGNAGLFDRDNTPALPRAAYPEAVVFPRDGKPLDQRPVQLRHARATARYRQDGGEPRGRDGRA